MSQTKYAAFLRGINLGKRSIKMDQLKLLFEGLGFLDVKTVLASGNVIFEATGEINDLISKIENKLEDNFKFKVDVILKTEDNLKKLIKSDPFKAVKITPDTRLYITFTDKEEIVSSFVVTKDKNSTDFMKEVEKIYGKRITTRNWNTVNKIVKLMDH